MVKIAIDILGKLVRVLDLGLYLAIGYALIASIAYIPIAIQISIVALASASAICGITVIVLTGIAKRPARDVA